MGNIRDHEQISLDETKSMFKEEHTSRDLNNLTFRFVRPYMILYGKI